MHIIKKRPGFWWKPVCRRMKTIGARLHRYSVRGPMRDSLMGASSSRLISEQCNRSPNSFVSVFRGKKCGIWLYRLWSLSSQVLSVLLLMVLNSQSSQWTLAPGVPESTEAFHSLWIQYNLSGYMPLKIWVSGLLVRVVMLRGICLKVGDKTRFLMLLNFFRCIHCFLEVWYRDISWQV